MTKSIRPSVKTQGLFSSDGRHPVLMRVRPYRLSGSVSQPSHLFLPHYPGLCSCIAFLSRGIIAVIAKLHFKQITSIMIFKQKN